MVTFLENQAAGTGMSYSINQFKLLIPDAQSIKYWLQEKGKWWIKV
jgi:hypothetical protein